MQPFVDHAAAVAALRSLATQATTAADNFPPTDKALVFKAYLDAIRKDGEPPMMDMMMTCVGDLLYRQRVDGFLAFVAQLAADGEIPAPTDPALAQRIAADSDTCDLHKQDFANFGQDIRDLLDTPGLRAVLGI